MSAIPAARLVLSKFGELPSMSAEHAAKMEAFLREHRLRDCLELGFQHGKSSAVIAATLRDLGEGHLTTVDREEARAHNPNIDAVLAELGLAEWVTVHYEPRSYTWRLMKLIEAHPEPAFDFCYIDGGHSWDVTGYGFCLVDRLLRPGGWILFDDLDWTFDLMVVPGREVPAFLRRMTAEERATPQVRRVWELLVRRHPGYGEFAEDGQWAFARKLRRSPATVAAPEASRDAPVVEALLAELAAARRAAEEERLRLSELISKRDRRIGELEERLRQFG